MYRHMTCIFHEIIPLRMAIKMVYIHDFKEGEKMLSRLTRGGRKNKGPECSAGQWPSLACKAEKKCAPLLTAVVAVSSAISSPSPTFTCGIVCLKFFSLKNCSFFFAQMKCELVKNKFKRKGKLTSKVSIYLYNCSKLREPR